MNFFSIVDGSETEVGIIVVVVIVGGVDSDIIGGTANEEEVVDAEIM